ncbi:MAG: histone deacetylase [Saprospiraceae bacterium]|jgi:acetoin utilization deacetylase AcuC-like enzyme|nr:MAG: histone deacetylase [Saprospiraceae bacterium]
MLKISWSPIYRYPLPPGHRFPMEKYELLPEQLLYEGTVRPDNFFQPDPLPLELLLLTHDASYWDKLTNQCLSPKEERAIGFPMTPRLVERSLHIANGTLLAAHHAFQHGIGMNIAGGTHHAFSNRGEGFCVLNDIAIAANALLHEGLADRILIVDLDVHQGNGTARIFRDEPRVFTFSMHGARNYPLRKEHSDLDIGLPDCTDDALYLRLLTQTLPALIDRVQPDIIFFQAGVDVLAEDRLGRLSLTLHGCAQRDRFVLATAHRHRIPIAVSMGGGYPSRLATLLEAHANTYRIAQELFF